jgi:hypothetical protein
VNGIPGRYSRYSPSNRGVCVSVLLNPTLIDTRPYGTITNTPEAMSSKYPDRITLQLRFLKDDVAAVDDNNDQNAVSDGPSSTGGVLPLADYLVIG